MKWLFAAIFILSIVIQPVVAIAVPMDFSGGVNDEYQYQEYVFLSGEPVKFTGTYKVTETDAKDKKTFNYKFTLTPEDTTLTGSLSRQVTYIVDYTSRNDKGQTIAQTSLSKIQETVNINGVKYVLKDYQFSKSDVIDNRPVSDFYSGNFTGRKYYTINNTEGTAIVDISGGNVGYNNFWGNTDTQTITQDIDVERKTTSSTDLSWHGNVKIQVSDSTVKTLQYSENAADYSSFQGGYTRVTNRETVSEYVYDLPKVTDDVPSATRRTDGTADLNEKMVPTVERLVVPKFRDIGGHWAEDDINMLYSLDVYDDTAEFFMPEVPMTRTEFTKAVMRSCNIRPTADKKKTSITAKSKTPEVSKFNDVATTDSDYQYIKDAVNKGIIMGVTKDMFKPKDPLTRAAAVVILIRALGFENKAPTPGYSTSFDDDSSIPEWAKDSVYVAKEMGIVSGDNNNHFNPDKQLTRAEASALLVKFLNFLEKDLQKDYRDNIILYN